MDVIEYVGESGQDQEHFEGSHVKVVGSIRTQVSYLQLTRMLIGYLFVGAILSKTKLNVRSIDCFIS